MKYEDIDRADVAHDVVTHLLKGYRVLIVGTTLDAASDTFATIADAFVEDDGGIRAGVDVRKTKGRERLDLPNGARLYTASVRNADLGVRGMVVDRIYTPADTGSKLLRIFEAVTIASAAPTVIRYADRVEA